MPPFARRALAAVLTMTSLAAVAGTPGQCRSTTAVEFPGTIVDAAVATPALSTLTSLVVAANLAGPLSAPGNLTVYAPTNDAFAKVPSGVLAAIGADSTLLTSVLTYHVVGGPADPRSGGVRRVTSLQGQTLFTGWRPGIGPTVNQSTASCTAVRTTNGTVWIIDSVLLPQLK
jgi:uncharacterized surface protein with fasciclin (FAS1) repeats